MCSLINKQLLLTAYAYLFIMEQQNGQRGSEALQLETQKSSGARQSSKNLKYNEAMTKKFEWFCNGACPRDMVGKKVKFERQDGEKIEGVFESVMPMKDTFHIVLLDDRKTRAHVLSRSGKVVACDGRRAPSSLVQPDTAALLFKQFRENVSFRYFVTEKNIELAGKLGKPGEPEAKLEPSDWKKLANLAKKWPRQGTVPTIAEEFGDELRIVLLEETGKNWDIRVTELLNTWRRDGVTILKVHDHVERKTDWFQTKIEPALKPAIVAALGNMKETAKHRVLEAQKKAAEQAKKAGAGWI